MRQFVRIDAHWPFAALVAILVASIDVSGAPLGQATQNPSIEAKVLATTKTSTLEKELNEAAEAGFRFASVMGGETAIGGKEVVAVLSRTAKSAGRYAYKLLATSKTSTMDKELHEAADAGFEYRGQTVFDSLFGGQEVVVILERDKEATEHNEYKLISTTKTSTLEKELSEAGAAGYAVVGMTVSKTALGGKELVAIVKRPTTR